MSWTLRTQARFEAAHRLDGHDGPCARIHGHSYRVEVFIERIEEADLSPIGIAVDFGKVKAIIRELDHQDLSTMFERSSAERLSAWIADRVRNLCPSHAIVRVRVWETDDSYAEWRDAAGE